ncbi:MAG: ABC transporter ATP-binding protein [Candidatus Omnitrophica bacterium]|nr:ABC transporter ATP-binding protein [Candidatus Omnitrophota bacterium]
MVNIYGSIDNMHTPLFSLKDVWFSYLGKIPALSGVDIDIYPGQKVSLVGANGSGKSTLLHLLDGLIFADRGSVSFLAKRLEAKAFADEKFDREFRRRVGFVFQNPDVQLFCPTVKEDIVFGPLHLGFEKNEISRRLEKIIGILDIGSLLDRSAHQLSVGEKRKVAIASTLIIEPDILIFDEPTAGLDPQTSRKIIDLLVDRSLESRTVITSTHDLHIVEEISDVVCVLGQRGRIIRSGQPGSILSDADLLAENNLAHIHSHRHKDKVHVHEHEHSEHHSQE